MHVLLNNADHGSLRIRTERSAAFGDGVMAAPVYPHEFRQAQSHYPIVFSKDRGTGFRPVALFGFEDGENLFLDDAGWDAGYIPLSIRMKPFLIGRAPSTDEFQVHLDLDHPRVSSVQGEPLFLPHGGHAPFLKTVAALLSAVHEAEESLTASMTALTRLDLLEPFTLDVDMGSGQKGRLAGFYTIAEERLATLSTSDLAKLHETGQLLPVFMAVASLSRFEELVHRRRRIKGRD